MSEFKRCPACKGKKRIMGMGMIKWDDCKYCLGVGHVKNEEQPTIVETAEEAAAIQPEIHEEVSAPAEIVESAPAVEKPKKPAVKKTKKATKKKAK
jgi:phage/plasmid primase-like uncharacterized protein